MTDALCVREDEQILCRVRMGSNRQLSSVKTAVFQGWDAKDRRGDCRKFLQLVKNPDTGRGSCSDVVRRDESPLSAGRVQMHGVESQDYVRRNQLTGRRRETGAGYESRYPTRRMNWGIMPGSCSEAISSSHSFSSSICVMG